PVGELGEQLLQRGFPNAPPAGKPLHVHLAVLQEVHLPVFPRDPDLDGDGPLPVRGEAVVDAGLLQLPEEAEQLVKAVRFHLSDRPSAHPALRPNSTARRVAASTASIRAARTPPRSRACSPAMVVPPGLATASLSAPACSPVSSTILAEPSTVCAARAVATSRGSPTRPPPADSASIIT